MRGADLRCFPAVKLVAGQAAVAGLAIRRGYKGGEPVERVAGEAAHVGPRLSVALDGLGEVHVVLGVVHGDTVAAEVCVLDVTR